MLTDICGLKKAERNTVGRKIDLEDVEMSKADFGRIVNYFSTLNEHKVYNGLCAIVGVKSGSQPKKIHSIDEVKNVKKNAKELLIGRIIGVNKSRGGYSSNVQIGGIHWMQQTGSVLYTLDLGLYLTPRKMQVVQFDEINVSKIEDVDVHFIGGFKSTSENTKTFGLTVLGRLDDEQRQVLGVEKILKMTHPTGDIKYKAFY